MGEVQISRLTEEGHMKAGANEKLPKRQESFYPQFLDLSLWHLLLLAKNAHQQYRDGSCFHLT